MTDRDKVVKGLEVCTQPGSCRECPYWRVYDSTIERCAKELMLDALELLNEPVSPKVDIDTYVCGVCGARLERQSMIGPNVVVSEFLDYCPVCGRKVKWE